VIGNDIDNGRYHVHTGMEGAGVVEEVASDVTEVRVGDRVAYAGIVSTSLSQRLLTWSFGSSIVLQL